MKQIIRPFIVFVTILLSTTKFNNAVHAISNKNHIKKNTTENDHHYDNKDLFTRSIQANQILLKLSEKCIRHHANNHEEKEALFWIGISALDKLGHPYGPDSYECVDMIYHLDKQLGDFFETVYSMVDSEDCLIALTSDHGITPIPELLNKQGFDLAQRIERTKIMEEMNQLIEKDFGLVNIVPHAKTNAFYLDHQQLDQVDSTIKQAIISRLQTYLMAQPAMKQVWTPDQLNQHYFADDSLERLYQNQLYEGRSGDLICMPHPFCHISKGPGGASHQTPHEHNLHVPLILYQPEQFEQQNIHEKVWIPQLPVTLAKILSAPRPSASTFSLLP